MDLSFLALYSFIDSHSPFGINAVIMQALKQAPPDMTCKDKFLIQSRIVTAETKEEELTSEMVGADC